MKGLFSFGIHKQVRLLSSFGTVRKEYVFVHAPGKKPRLGFQGEDETSSSSQSKPAMELSDHERDRVAER